MGGIVTVQLVYWGNAQSSNGRDSFFGSTVTGYKINLLLRIQLMQVISEVQQNAYL